MNVTLLQALDLCLRCAALGQLLLLTSFALRRPFSGRELAVLGVASCFIGYLLLTAPIPDEDYGIARGILLAVTDALAYAIWIAAMYFFRGDFSPQKWSRFTKLLLAGFGLGYLYFFTVLEGVGILHDFNHVIAIVVLAHVIYVALIGHSDDLSDPRRRARVIIALLVSVYGIALATAELADEWLRHHPLFGLFNAGFLLLAFTLLGRTLLSAPAPAVGMRIAAHDQRQNFVSIPENFAPMTVPPQWRELEKKLTEFMDEGGYRQTELTITALANQLRCPEHHLRKLINSCWKFDNFSSFLNSYRLRDAQAALADTAQAGTPILSIALNLGYGSIGPFNRAFKSAIGQTPGEYRRSVQNQR